MSHKKIKRKHNKLLIFITILSMPVFLAYISMQIFLTISNYNSYEYYTDSIYDYHDFATHGEKELFSLLKIFPESEEKINSIKSYHYHYKDKTTCSSYEIFLDCIYNEDNFNTEIERLKKVGIFKNDANLNDDDFSMPFYTCIFDYNHIYEYALVDSENKRITYVYLQNMDKSKIKIGKEFLPKSLKDNNDIVAVANEAKICVY